MLKLNNPAIQSLPGVLPDIFQVLHTHMHVYIMDYIR